MVSSEIEKLHRYLLDKSRSGEGLMWIQSEGKMMAGTGERQNEDSKVHSSSQNAEKGAMDNKSTRGLEEDEVAALIGMVKDSSGNTKRPRAMSMSASTEVSPVKKQKPTTTDARFAASHIVLSCNLFVCYQDLQPGNRLGLQPLIVPFIWLIYVLLY